MTAQKLRLLDSISSFSADNGRPPTFDELAELLGCSASTVKTRVDRLRAEGYIEPSAITGLTRSDGRPSNE